MEEDNQVQLSLTTFDAFVAKQIDKENRYRLFIIDGTHVDLSNGVVNVEIGTF